jgi:DNA-damage-inducible protein D
MIRSRGNKALFGYSTSEIKTRLAIPKSHPLADFFLTITIKAKDFASEITIFNVKEKDIKHGHRIAWEHIRNNKGVRKLLLKEVLIRKICQPRKMLKNLNDV